MAKPLEVTVGEHAFVIQPLDAFEALAIFGDLQRDILPAAGGLFALVDSNDAARDEAAMADAIARLSARLDGKQLSAWANRLLTPENISVEVNGNLMKLGPAARAMGVFIDFTGILELMFHALKFWFAGPIAVFLNRTGVGLSQVRGKLSAPTQTQ